MVNQQDKIQEFSKKSLITFTTQSVIFWIPIIGAVLFFNGLFNNFVADDPPEITQNPIIQSIQNVPQFFTGSLFYMGPGQKLGGNFYRPLQSVYFSAIYSVFGPNYFFYHLFQEILFIANACLLFLILKKVLGNPLAFLASLLFLIHPINSESVFYISATQEVLFLFFGLLSLWVMQRYESHKAVFLSSLFLFCSILSKETGLLFFFIVPLYTFLFHRKRFFPLLAYLLVFLGLYFLLRINAIGIIPAVTKNAPIQELTLTGRLINIPQMFLFYVKTFFFPVDLASVNHWVVRQVSLPSFYLPLLLDTAFLAVLSTFAYFLKRKSSTLFIPYLFFLVWFLVGMLLHMQIIPLDQTVTDQWFYFPMVGLLGMGGIVLSAWKVHVRSVIFLSIVIAIITLLSVRTFIRSFDWRDDFTLASRDITVSKEAYPLYHELSRIYIDRGQYTLAKIYAEKSIQQFPYVFNYTDLGNADFSLHEYALAKKAYQQALTYGDNFTTYENLAALYINYGDPKEGIVFIQKNLKTKYPTDARLWLYLAVLEYRINNVQEAKMAISYADQYNTGIPEIPPIYTIIMTEKPLQYKIGK